MAIICYFNDLEDEKDTRSFERLVQVDESIY